MRAAETVLTRRKRRGPPPKVCERASDRATDWQPEVCTLARELVVCVCGAVRCGAVRCGAAASARRGRELSVPTFGRCKCLASCWNLIDAPPAEAIDGPLGMAGVRN